MPTAPAKRKLKASRLRTNAISRPCRHEEAIERDLSTSIMWLYFRQRARAKGKATEQFDGATLGIGCAAEDSQLPQARLSGAAGCGGRYGKVKENSAPLSTELLADTRQPWRAIMRCTVARQTPVPGHL